MTTYVLTLTGERGRRLLAEHPGLSSTEAHELTQIYVALGHDAKRITVTPSTVVEAA